MFSPGAYMNVNGVKMDESIFPPQNVVSAFNPFLCNIY